MSNWCGALVGVLFAFSGALKVVTGKPSIRWGVEIPAWTGWITFPFGVWVLFVSVRALWRNRNTPKPVVNIDEEAARAEAAMDAMYLRDHGEPPEKPKKDA